MARSSDFDTFFIGLTSKPWWASAALGAGFFVLFRYVIPNLPVDYGLFEYAVNTICPLISWAAVLFLIPAIGSLVRRMRGERLLTFSKTGQSLTAMHWQTFEELIEAYYRNLGYKVQRQLEQGPDGGVDVRITNDRGERVLVQCKQYRDTKVTVNTVRELMGVVAAERATGGIVITTSTFTNEAWEFAEGVPIELIDGDRLDRMLNDLPE